MAYFAGETITDSVLVLENGAPLIGAPEAVILEAIVYLPNGQTTTPTVKSRGNGLYDVTFQTTPGQAGRYAVTLVASTGQRFLQTYDVDQRDATTAAAASGYGENTRAGIRSMVGDMLRDCLRLTATEDGSTTTLTDTIELVDGQDAYLSSMGVVVSCSAPENLGKQFRVESSNKASRTIAFSPALPSPVVMGDTVHLMNLGGYGFRLQHYNEAIATAVRMAYPDVLLPLTITADSLFDASGPGWPIPEDMVAIHAMEAKVGDDWQLIPRARQTGRHGIGWSVDRGLRMLTVGSPTWRESLDGREFRVRGFTRLLEPRSDADVIAMDATWVTYQTASLLAARRNSDQTWSNWAVEWGRQAMDMRMRLQTPRPPGTIWL